MRCRNPMTTLLGLLVVTIPLIASPNVGQAQCRGSDDYSTGMIAELRQLVSATDEVSAASRRDLQIPVVDTTTIVLLTHAPSCNKALSAYVASLPPDFPTPLPTNVYVVKVGDKYVVMSPSASLPQQRHTVMDSRFRVLATYAA